jgi:hypothetical protein
MSAVSEKQRFKKIRTIVNNYRKVTMQENLFGERQNGGI